MSGLTKRHDEGAALRRAVELGHRTEVLAFQLAGEAYAVRIELVTDILRPPPLTEVPRAPSPLRGLVSVRGRLSTVVDLRSCLRLTSAPIEAKSRLLLATHDGESMALLVDEVRQVYRLAEAEIEPAAALGGEQPPYIWGIARPAGGELLVLLDVRQLLEGLA